MRCHQVTQGYDGHGIWKVCWWDISNILWKIEVISNAWPAILYDMNYKNVESRLQWIEIFLYLILASDAYMRHQLRSPLVQIMACRLSRLGSAPMFHYIVFEIQTFALKKWIWKCLLKNVVYFVEDKMYQFQSILRCNYFTKWIITTTNSSFSVLLCT